MEENVRWDGCNDISGRPNTVNVALTGFLNPILHRYAWKGGFDGDLGDERYNSKGRDKRLG